MTLHSTHHHALQVKGSPEYVRIYKELHDKIVSLRFLPNEKLPSEKELCEHYKVSRYTIRHALELLVIEGLIVRQQGKASYVRPLNGSDTQSLQPHELHLACLNQPQVLLTQFQYKFARRVAELTSGTVQVIIHHSSEFGSGEEEVKAVMEGRVDMFCGAVEWLAQLDPAYAVGTFPFLFRDMAHTRLFLQHPVLVGIRSNLTRQHGIRLLATNWLRPSRVLLTTRPCFNLEDIAQLRIGIPAIPLYRDIWNCLGAQTEDVNFHQRKKAFQQGLINATDVNFDVIVSERLYTDAQYATCMNHSFSRAGIIISEKCFQSFRADTRAALLQAAEEVGAAYSRYLMDKYDSNKRLMLQHDVNFIEINTTHIRRQVDQFFRDNAQQNHWPVDLYDLIKSLD